MVGDYKELGQKIQNFDGLGWKIANFVLLSAVADIATKIFNKNCRRHR
jgi:hypothetical protein